MHLKQNFLVYLLVMIVPLIQTFLLGRISNLSHKFLGQAKGFFYFALNEVKSL
jgi:hypothetical protein